MFDVIFIYLECYMSDKACLYLSLQPLPGENL